MFKTGDLGSGESHVGGCNGVYDDHENCEAMPGPVRDSYQHLDGLCPLCPATAGHRLAGVIWRNVRDKDEPQIQLFVLIKVE